MLNTGVQSWKIEEYAKKTQSENLGSPKIGRQEQREETSPEDRTEGTLEQQTTYSRD